MTAVALPLGAHVRSLPGPALVAVLALWSMSLVAPTFAKRLW